MAKSRETDAFHVGYHRANTVKGRKPKKALKRIETALQQQAQTFVDTIKKEKRLECFGDGLFDPTIVNLEEIHEKLGKSDAFVFLPSNDIDHDLKILSMVVGVQTGDKNMFTRKIDGQERQKPIIVVNEHNIYKPLLDLIAQTEFIRGPVKDAITTIKRFDSKSIVEAIRESLSRIKKPSAPLDTAPNPANDLLKYTGIEPDFKVCVFCSASSSYTTPDGGNLAFDLGAALAEAGFGVVSGAGSKFMMGDLIWGARSKGGWTAGSNTPHVRPWEELPDSLNTYIDMPDIYTRMKVMIQGSDGFIIAPGGAGTIQEFLALMHYKKRDSSLMKDKPIVILNPRDKNGKGYWDPLIDYAKKRHLDGMFEVAHTAEEAQRIMGEKKKLMPAPLSTPWCDLVQRQKELLEQQNRDSELHYQTAS